MSRGRTAVFLLLAAWLLFLAVQRGDEYDESEHCHVAWMMGRLHQQPLRDFFQHHQPFLWELLQTYYVVGGDGPEVMYFGRALVVVCALVFAVGLFLLSRLWARGDPGAPPPGLLGGLLGAAPLVLMSLTTRPLLVIRPETIGLPFFALAAACWVRPGGAGRWAGVWRGLLAGALFGAALFASPRFAVLAGGFLLLPADRGRLFSREILPLLAAAPAAAAVVAGGQLLATGRLSDLFFNLQISALTYKTGDAMVRASPRLLVFGGEAVLAAAWVFLRLDGPGRRRFLVQAVYLGLTTAAALASSWPRLYPQNFFAPVVWLGVMFACAAGRTEAARVPTRPTAAFRWALVASAVCLLLALRDVAAGESIVARVEQKRALLALLRPGERVLLTPVFHPICAADATYYVTPIVDQNNEWGRVAPLARQRRWNLPDCDYFHDILEGKPALLDDALTLALPEGDRGRFRELLDREYTLVRLFPSLHRCYRLKDPPPGAPQAAAAAFP